MEASIEPFGRACTDNGVQLVDKEDDLPVRGRDFLQDRLEALLEFAAELGTGNQRTQVQRDDPLVLQALGNVAAHDALGKTLDNRGLAHARLADQDGIVLGSAREHLDDPPNLFVAADHRVEFAVAGQLGEVPPILFERLVLAFGILVSHALIPANLSQGAVARDPW